MSRFLFTRAFRTFLTLFGVVLLTFVLGRSTGDPVAMLLPQTATVEDLERIRTRLGLNEPLHTQFAIYIANLFQGDFGTSITFNRPALSVVAERIPLTLQLGVPALVLATAIGLPLGVLVARHQNGVLDRLVMSVTLAGQALPPFFIGILLILLFGVTLRLTPTFGSDTPAHLILPTLTLIIYPLAIIVRLTRSSMLEVLNTGYVRTARAKGLSDQTVVFRHALRNALIPVITVVGLQVATIISGAAIVETVFAWPGIGQLAVQSIGGRDYPVIQTIVLISAAAFCIVNMVVDVLYLLVDPRIRGRVSA
jgi:ABC-type dipeptide/oligopeptide/nickel transport system permease component